VALRFIRSVFEALGYLAPALGGRLAALLFRSPRRHQAPLFEQEIRARADAHARVLHEGLELDVLEWGDGDRAVLLVHGWEGRGTHLGRFVDPLVAAGFRVVAFDGPAHGASGGSQTDAVNFSRAFYTLSDAAGPFYALVAHSFGGASAMLAMSRGFPVERAVIIGAPSQLSYVLGRFRETVGLPETVWPHFLRHLERRIGHPPLQFDAANFAGTLQLPGMVVHCQDDIEISFEQAELTHAAWPGSRLLATSGLGHRRILKDPEVIASVTAFLLERTPRAGASSSRDD
jgi:pimeloyl-ACP methyl ester carboxylesterase